MSWSLVWLFIAIAAWLRKEEVMQSMGFLTMFPLMFACRAFVPIESLPDWLGACATINPLSYAWTRPGISPRAFRSATGSSRH